MTVAVLFALSLFLAPILSIVPVYATSAALMIVGAMMMGTLRAAYFRQSPLSSLCRMAATPYPAYEMMPRAVTRYYFAIAFSFFARSFFARLSSTR